MSHPDPDPIALDALQLVPMLLHEVVEPDLSLELLGGRRESPILRRRPSPVPGDGLALVDAEALDQANRLGVPVLRPAKMGELMAEVRRLVALDVPALALDMTPLADSGPFGHQPWRPRTREDLAELAAAAGRPLWLLGVASPEDATVAAEAGLDAVVVDSVVGRHIGAPATADLLPEVVDAVAGMLKVVAGGTVGSGVEVFKLLALGADAVLVGGERPSDALLQELRYAMRMTRCATLADIGYDAVFVPLFGQP